MAQTDIGPEEVKYLQQLSTYGEPFTLIDFLNDFYPCHDIWLKRLPFISLQFAGYLKQVDAEAHHVITPAGIEYLQTTQPYYLSEREWKILKQLYPIRQFTRKEAFEQLGREGEVFSDFTYYFQTFLQHKVITIGNAGTKGAEDPGYIDYVLTDKGKRVLGKSIFWP